MAKGKRPSAPEVIEGLSRSNGPSDPDCEQQRKRLHTAPRDDGERILPRKKPEADGEWPLKRYLKGDFRADLRTSARIEETVAVDTSKPTNIFKPTGCGTASTLSIAIPGSILTLAKTFELKAQLAARIARAAAVFCVDEIVIFDDGDDHGTDAADILLHILRYLECPPFLRRRIFPPHDYLRMAGALPSVDMPHHLRRDEWCQYREAITLDVEDPQTIANASDKNTSGSSQKRKRSVHVDSHYATSSAAAEAELSPRKKRKSESKLIASQSTQGSNTQTFNFTQLLSLEGDHGSPPPPHPIFEQLEYPPTTQVKTINKSIVDCGFPFTITVSIRLPPNTRVTIRFPGATPPPNFPSLNAAQWFGDDPTEPGLHATVVDGTEPKDEKGYYWGYNVRVAKNLTGLFAACPYKGGYDVTIGTSERGIPLSDIIPLLRSKNSSSGYQKSIADTNVLPEEFDHALIVFGGVAGLEKALEHDHGLQELVEGNKMDVRKVFDFYVNAVPGQGSRTIRSEEAVWIVLGMLGAWIKWAKR